MSLLHTVKRKIMSSDPEKLVKLQSQLQDAEAAREAAYAAIGEAAADERSATTAAAEYEAAITRERSLQAAITTVQRRIQAAAERARVDEMRQKRETFRIALAAVQEKARVVDADFEGLHGHARDLFNAIAEAAAVGRALGDSGEALTSRLVRGKQAFESYGRYAMTITSHFGRRLERHGPYSSHFPRPDEI